MQSGSSQAALPLAAKEEILISWMKNGYPKLNAETKPIITACFTECKSRETPPGYVTLCHTIWSRLVSQHGLDVDDALNLSPDVERSMQVIRHGIDPNPAGFNAKVKAVLKNLDLFTDQPDA